MKFKTIPDDIFQRLELAYEDFNFRAITTDMRLEVRSGDILRCLDSFRHANPSVAFYPTIAEKHGHSFIGVVAVPPKDYQEDLVIPKSIRREYHVHTKERGLRYKSSLSHGASFFTKVLPL